LNKFILYIAVIIGFVSCVSAPDYPDEPFIEFMGMDKTSMVQNTVNSDSVFVFISFTDGDGDLGYGVTDTMTNVFIRDSRSGFIQDRFKTPEVPPEGANNGISGTLRILLYTTCCIFPEGIPPCAAPDQFPTDTLHYEIFLKDRAGNESNIIRTSDIILFCD
jgi:hypothetical protein